MQHVQKNLSQTPSTASRKPISKTSLKVILKKQGELMLSRKINTHLKTIFIILKFHVWLVTQISQFPKIVINNITTKNEIPESLIKL